MDVRYRLLVRFYETDFKWAADVTNITQAHAVVFSVGKQETYWNVCDMLVTEVPQAEIRNGHMDQVDGRCVA